MRYNCNASKIELVRDSIGSIEGCEVKPKYYDDLEVFKNVRESREIKLFFKISVSVEKISSIVIQVRSTAMMQCTNIFHVFTVKKLSIAKCNEKTFADQTNRKNFDEIKISSIARI